MSYYTATHHFEVQFKQLYRPLCLFAMRFLEQAEDAEDIVQQAFADAWEKTNNGSPILQLKPYLYQAVRNRSLSLIAQSPFLQSAEGIPDQVDWSVEEDMLCAERDARLWQAIDQLPAKRKKIFLLAKHDGKKYKEIAEELHISIKTVENQMTKALNSLRQTTIRIYMFVIG